MKKLLVLLGIFSFTSFFAANETACFFNRKPEKPTDPTVTSAIEKINGATDINIKGFNVIADASNPDTTKVILDNIGLTEEEQQITTITGTLSQDIESTLTFTVADNSPITKSVL
jgi:hypothetical protein